MARIQVSCPHCNQLMQVNATDANRRLRCTRCRESFRMNDDNDTESVPVTTVPCSGDSESVIGVKCHVCDSKFGIKSAMSGRTVACPTCKAKQKFLIADDEAALPKAIKRKKRTTGEAGTNPENDEAVHERKSSPATVEPSPSQTEASVDDSPHVEQKAVASKAETATENDPGDPAVSSMDSMDSRKASDLLPPTYTVPEEIETRVLAEFTNDAPAGIVLGIDTELTRIHSGDQAIEVRTVSRKEKMRRRRIRAGIVYLLSVGILVAWFIYLLKRS